MGEGTSPFKQSAGVEVEDIAKRLMDYGFHAPTKDLVEGVPKAVKEGVSKEEAEKIKEKIENAGGQADIK